VIFAPAVGPSTTARNSRSCATYWAPREPVPHHVGLKRIFLAVVLGQTCHLVVIILSENGLSTTLRVSNNQFVIEASIQILLCAPELLSPTRRRIVKDLR